MRTLLVTLLLSSSLQTASAQAYIVRTRKDWAATYANQARAQGIEQRAEADRRWKERLSSVGQRPGRGAEPDVVTPRPLEQVVRVTTRDRVCSALRKLDHGGDIFKRLQRYSATVEDQPKQYERAVAQWAALHPLERADYWLKECNTHEVIARRLRFDLPKLGAPLDDSERVGNPPGRLPKEVWSKPTFGDEAFGNLKPASTTLVKPEVGRNGSLARVTFGDLFLRGSRSLAFKRQLLFDGPGGALSSVVDTQYCLELKVARDDKTVDTVLLSHEALPRYAGVGEAALAARFASEGKPFRPETRMWSTQAEVSETVLPVDSPPPSVNHGWREDSAAAIKAAVTRHTPKLAEGDTVRISSSQGEQPYIHSVMLSVMRKGRTVFRRAVSKKTNDVTDTYCCDTEKPLPCRVTTWNYEQTRRTAPRSRAASDAWAEVVTFSPLSPRDDQRVDQALALPQGILLRPGWRYSLSRTDASEQAPSTKPGDALERDAAADVSHFTVRRAGEVVFYRRARKHAFGVDVDDTYFCGSPAAQCAASFSRYTEKGDVRSIASTPDFSREESMTSFAAPPAPATQRTWSASRTEARGGAQESASTGGRRYVSPRGCVGLLTSTT